MAANQVDVNLTEAAATEVGRSSLAAFVSAFVSCCEL